MWKNYFFFLFLLFYQGEKSKQTSTPKGEQSSEKPSERKTPGDILSLRTEGKNWEKSPLIERDRRQKESEELEDDKSKETNENTIPTFTKDKESKYQIGPMCFDFHNDI